MSSKLSALLWKNFLTRQNHMVVTFIEVVLPVIVFLLVNVSVPKDPSNIYLPLYDVEFIPCILGCYMKWTDSSTIIAYEPSTPFTDELMIQVACCSQVNISLVKKSLTLPFDMGVKFEGLSDTDYLIPEHLKFTLYPRVFINDDSLEKWHLSDLNGSPNPRVGPIAKFQRIIDSCYMDMRNISVDAILMDQTNVIVYSLSYLLFYAVFYLSFLMMFPPLMGRILHEKSSGAKELMLMMGVSRKQLWFAKFIDVLVFFTITLAGMFFFAYVPIKKDPLTLKQTSSGFLAYVIIMYGLIAMVIFVFFLSCFFEKPALGIFIIVVLMIFGFFLVNFVVKLARAPHEVVRLLYIFPFNTLMNLVVIILNYDEYGEDIALYENVAGNYRINLMEVLIALTLNIIVYGILTWYAEQVMPGKYGVPQPYGFFLKASYWRSDVVLRPKSNRVEKLEAFELVPPSLKVGVDIKGVSKTYKGQQSGFVTAVDNVNLKFYQGEISALLGHNGAGKTTLFSIITGLICPTYGTVTLNGYDLVKNKDKARSSLGLCPQHDMLFGDLTVYQMIKFYGVIKGLSFKNSTKQTRRLIKKLKLTTVKSTRGENLSGGQKRKVSLAIAIIGGSEVLVLDEPSSGMDPEIRREIWKILFKFRGKRTILLTTHFMEEADALCDRIAIMDHGKIKCFGSPMFLKSKFGSGYVLSVVVNNMEDTRLLRYIQRYVATAKYKSKNVNTLKYDLPENEMVNFPALLSFLDSKKATEEITSYSIELSTLEDTFLRISEEEEYNKVAFNLENFNFESVAVPKVTGFALYFVQFEALMYKKWIATRRTWLLLLLISSLTIVLVVLVPFLLKDLESQLSNETSVKLDSSLYAGSLGLISGKTPKNILDSFVQYMTELNYTIEVVPDIENGTRSIFHRDITEYVRKLTFAVGMEQEQLQTVLVNEDAAYMTFVILNILDNFAIKFNNDSSKITTWINFQYSTVKSDDDEEGFIKKRSLLPTLPHFSAALLLYFLLQPIVENYYNSKELQRMIVPSFLYWITHLLFDFTIFFLFVVTLSFILGLSQKDDFMFEYNTGKIITALAFWVISLLLIGYIITLFVHGIATAVTFCIFMHIITAFIIPSEVGLTLWSSRVQYVHPTTVFKYGLILESQKKRPINYVLYLFLYDLGLFCILILLDTKYVSVMSHFVCTKLGNIRYGITEKDSFVAEEEQFVKNLSRIEKKSNYPLIAVDLKRWFSKNCKPMAVVRGVSFAIKRGECFGLLGVNGAGKTSTFRMLIGSLHPSNGKIFIESQRLNNFTFKKNLSAIGYCPQTSGFIPSFTGNQMLVFFAKLRGMRNSVIINEEVKKWIEQLDLVEYATKRCGKYSGGNQRKLSTALSLIGDSSLIFLDEPTSGVDPISRRAIWDVVNIVRNEGRSVILTSHSMDECEALCSRLAIMVNGRFSCIGEVTTLKERFGVGFSVQLKVSNNYNKRDLRHLKKAIKNTFSPGCKLVDGHISIFDYHFSNPDLTWSKVFQKLQELKEIYPILESYSISSTSLEQIFISFAKGDN